MPVLTPYPIPPDSWADPRVEKRESGIHQVGLFAIAPIDVDETVLIWGGSVFSWEDIEAGKAAVGGWVALTKTMLYGGTAEEGRSLADYANHSCDPNLWTVETSKWIARRPIERGEEITIDYATYWGPEDKEVITWECHCGAACCRRQFSSTDWRMSELHERYGNHFAPFIRECIRQLGEE